MLHIRYFVVTLLSFKAVESEMESFAVGGKKAVITDFPHSVFLGTACYTKSTNKPSHWICGASVLNQKIILTAAHCMYGCVPPSSFSVNMGHVHKEKGFSSLVKTYILHPHYNSRTTANDIGLAIIKATIKYDVNIKRIAVMPNPPYFERSYIAGWGLIDEIANKVDDVLRYIDQYVWQRSACLEVLQRLPDGTICASSGNPNSYSSRGDSGSALVVRGYIQIGIVSYKVPTFSRSLVVYTDTGYFYNWIRETAIKLSCL